MQDLQDEWQTVCQAVGVDPTRAQELFRELEQAYRGPGRFYHTLDHIQAMLGCIERLRDYASDLSALRLAAWFHDCVYDPRASDNEEQLERPGLSRARLAQAVLFLTSGVISTLQTSYAGPRALAGTTNSAMKPPCWEGDR